MAQVQAQERILRAARKIFAERGFDDASTKAIAETAGVPSGLIFYHFGNKEALLEAVFAGNTIVQGVSAAFDALGAVTDSRSALATVGHSVYRWLDANKELAQIFFREINSHRPIAKRLRQLRRGALERVAKFLEAEIAAGRLRPMNTALAAQMFGSSIMLAVLVDRPAKPQEYAHEMAGLLLGASR